MRDDRNRQLSPFFEVTDRIARTFRRDMEHEAIRRQLSFKRERRYRWVPKLFESEVLPSADYPLNPAHILNMFKWIAVDAKQISDMSIWRA